MGNLSSEEWTVKLICSLLCFDVVENIDFRHITFYQAIYTEIKKL